MSFDRDFIPVRFVPVVAAFSLLFSMTFLRGADAKPTPQRMDEAFPVTAPLSYTPWRSTPTAEATIRHEIFFDELEGSTAGWGVVNYRQGIPNAWHVVPAGANSCTGKAWWCGQTSVGFGDGYGNNWVQVLRTNVPITLNGTSNNKLTYKFRYRSEYLYDNAFVMIKDAAAGSRYDTLAVYSGDFGTSCINASIDIPNSWTTRPQPITLSFIFGSDLDISAADHVGPYQGWSLDDVKITAQGNNVRFFDDMELDTSKWFWEAPNPGSLWHIESAPGTAIPAGCLFLSSNVFVPFQGSGFGAVPDFVDAMLTTPPMNIQGVFSPNNPTTSLTLQFDDWINLPPENGVYWSLQICGSNNLTTWTPWRNATDGIYIGGNPQCIEGSTKIFNPYDTVKTGILPGTKYIRLGFRLRDEKLNGFPAIDDGTMLNLGVRTEGMYFDDVGVYNIYTISGVEPVSGVPSGTHAAIRKAFPNPFNPSTTLELSVPKQGPVTVRIFDLQGRNVATLLNEPMAPGVYRVRWNGQDDAGRAQSSGIYFAQIQSGGSQQAIRLTMLK